MFLETILELYIYIGLQTLIAIGFCIVLSA